MALKPLVAAFVAALPALAVPSYGAMALKRTSTIEVKARHTPLAVPSYGAMALKRRWRSLS